MVHQLLDLDHEVELTPEGGGQLSISSAGDGVSYDVRITDRVDALDGVVQIEGDGVIELLELVGRVLSTVIALGELSEETDVIHLTDLEVGRELRAVYCAEDEGEDPAPEGLMIEAIGGAYSHVVLTLAELPALQMQLTLMLMSGMDR